jgi:hypothetical protein
MTSSNRLRDLPSELDQEPPVFERSLLDLDVVFEVELTLERSRRDAPIKKLMIGSWLGLVIGLATSDRKLVLLSRNRDGHLAAKNLSGRFSISRAGISSRRRNFNSEFKYLHCHSILTWPELTSAPKQPAIDDRASAEPFSRPKKRCFSVGGGMGGSLL